MDMTLKAARVNKGYTQKQAAQMLNICKDSISNYERGATYPEIPLLNRMLALYGMQYDDIIFLSKKSD